MLVDGSKMEAELVVLVIGHDKQLVSAQKNLSDEVAGFGR